MTGEEARAAGLTGAGRDFGAAGLQVRYDDVVALDGVSIAVPAGQVTAVVGGDGAGKTSLLRCLAGALRPVAGEVRSPGKARIGYLPASSGVYPDLTATENLAFRAAAYGLPRATAATRAARMLDRAGLTAARNRPAGLLSGGMRQKLGVIAAMLPEPALLILDEPSTGVDPVSRSGLWSLITAAAAGGAAVVLSTTYLDDAQRSASVVVLDGGQVIAAGTAEQIIAAVPGSLRAVARQPSGDQARFAWRRGRSWRIWVPPGGASSVRTESGLPTGNAIAGLAGAALSPAALNPAALSPAALSPAALSPVAVMPDLQDAVTIAALAREVAAAGTSGRRLRTYGHVTDDRRDRWRDGQRPPTDEDASSRGGQPVGNSPVIGAAAGSRWRASVRVPSRLRFRGSQSVGGRPAAAPLAVAASVTCRFGDVTALRDVSIEISPGEIVGLLGANGAGKTTLIRVLLGLIPPTAGDVTLLGDAPDRTTRRRIGYVPQGLGLYADLSAAENLAFATAVFGPAGTASARAALAAPAGSDRVPVGRLPLGVQRRVAFAQALAHLPDLLILDEPTSGVDPLGRARLWETITQAAESGAGALVSTHYLEEAGECDRLVVMADGEVVAAGPETEIIGDARVTVVETADWPAAFADLERAGLRVSLAGRVLRVPGADPDQVRAVVPADARVATAPATLQERFFDLVVSRADEQVRA